MAPDYCKASGGGGLFPTHTSTKDTCKFKYLPSLTVRGRVTVVTFDYVSLLHKFKGTIPSVSEVEEMETGYLLR